MGQSCVLTDYILLLLLLKKQSQARKRKLTYSRIKYNKQNNFKFGDTKIMKFVKQRIEYWSNFSYSPHIHFILSLFLFFGASQNSIFKFVTC